jgi:hypothetical protein
MFPAFTPVVTQTVVQSTTYTTGLSSSIGVTVTDQYGNVLIPRIGNPTESPTGTYTLNIPGFDPSRTGFFVWDNAGAVFAKVPFQGPRLTAEQPAPGYKPQFPVVQR